jgi:hypothetical protein
MLVVGNVLLIVGIIGLSVSLLGVGSGTVVACAAVVALSTLLYVIAALRRRPRLTITPEGFVFEKLFGRDAHRWEEIDGQFAVIKIGLNKAVAYKLTPEYKARVGKKSTSLFSGYDAAVVGGALPRSAEELAELLNEHKQRNQASSGPVSVAGKSAESSAITDRPRD